MNKKLLFLTKNSLNKKLKSKWFKIVNILLCILIIGIVNIDSIINFFGGNFNNQLEIVVIDNTNEVSDIFKNNMISSNKSLDEDLKINIKTLKSSEKEVEKKLKDKVLVVFNSSKEEYLKAKVISEDKIDVVNYQLITNALSATKYNYGILKSNIDTKELQKISTPISIERKILDESKANEDDNMELIMGTVFPTVILPFFMLIIFLVQMIGAEIYEEKSTRSMEVIISNVSPSIKSLVRCLSFFFSPHTFTFKFKVSSIFYLKLLPLIHLLLFKDYYF